MDKPSWVGVALVALLLSFAVLIHDLDGVSLWNDEAWTIDATDPGGSLLDVADKLAGDVHPPLFFWELWGWRHIAGDTVFALRYGPLLLTLIGVALVYRLGLALFSPEAGIIAALFFGLHDLVRVYTQEVRHYPQQMTIAALALWLYWRYWTRPTRGRGIALALGGAALLWTHYWGGFVLLACAVHLVLTGPFFRRGVLQYAPTNAASAAGGSNRLTLLLPFAGMSLLFVPWLPSLARQMTDERPGGLPHALENSWTVFKALALHLLGQPELLWLLLAGAGLLAALGAIRRVSSASLLPALAVALTVGLSIAMNVTYPSLSPRSLAVILPPLAVLIGHALAQFRRPARAILVGFLVIQSLAVTSAKPPLRAPWPDVADFLAGRTTADDVILMELKNGEWNNLEEVTLSYYLDRAGSPARDLWTEARRLDDPEGFNRYLRRELDGVPGLWVTKLGWPYYDLRADLERLGFVATAPPVAWEPFTGWPLDAWRYDRPPEGDPPAAFDGVLSLARASVYAVGERVTVNLLWSPTTTPPQEYTVSAFLLDAGGRLASQHDSRPMEGRSRTSTWETGGLYFDSHTLPTDVLSPGEYQVGVKVYYFTDAAFTALAIAPCGAGCEFVIVGTVRIE